VATVLLKQATSRCIGRFLLGGRGCMGCILIVCQSKNLAFLKLKTIKYQNVDAKQKGTFID
jgi:hypothetical protein